ncbi:hypothetical protein RO3G_05749 [Rhizopus delemar RA 99-880]|uniref:CBM1 domain-containing protein n=1 Tax=Rhizopus delemar (strain RA 99-880 / ATCC MYA-4621 / FGSC 9543 / NRRL 43880) TaxID=246409 RepID=I1BXW4_RHIO9|nr:hypothetical protein RO3G_05749 [Rhizopus delemar RA 99-880]|eukprot:EIE81044.1 hypothetical protein RO3G_05749 [Rhizopus delemar RA 99-880]
MKLNTVVFFALGSFVVNSTVTEAVCLDLCWQDRIPCPGGFDAKEFGNCWTCCSLF